MAQAERCVNPSSRWPHAEPSHGAHGDGRYVVYGEIASGGMASVLYGRLHGPHGFTRPVAIKRLHPHFAKDAQLMAMFIDEARLSARLVHANIIHTLDVIQAPGELALVMEYVHGESLWALLRLAREQGRAVPISVACALLASTLHGLHAAHEAQSDAGEPLEIVHRDVSPPNILIGSDGIPRLLDFGIAKALGRVHSTPSGEIKGKLGYIAPEQLHAAQVDRRTDVYGASAVLWETLTGTPLFEGPTEPAVVHRVLYANVEPPSAHRQEIPPQLDAIVMRGLSRDKTLRFATAHDMALAIEQSTRLASQSEIATWQQELAGEQLAARARRLTEMQVAPAAESRGTTRRIPSKAPADDPADEAKTTRISTGVAALPKRRSRAWVIGGSLALLTLAAAWFASAAPQARSWFAGEPAELEKNAPAIPVANVVSPELPAPLEDESPSPKAEPAEPQPQPTAAASEERKRPPRRASNAQPPATHSAPANPPKVDPCVPFYIVDERGIRRPKPECF